MQRKKIAIISDIHGNMEAFEQVLTDIEKFNVDAVISLGDNIGYGPEPDRVIKYIKKHHISSVLGNHELAIIEPTYLSWFNVAAKRSLEKTLTLLSEPSIEFITTMKAYLTQYGCRFVHGFPPDSPLTYSFQVSEGKTQKAFDELSERRCFIGHTHTLDLISCDGRRLDFNCLKEGPHKLDPSRKYIISAGSVGQPRDGDNRSKYLIWDSSEDRLEVRFVTYDIAAVVRKIKEAGLPQEHAQRLWGNPILI
ncbi:MAG: metallophosphoesterase family protein [Desulfobacterales bacterium]|jgi:diadenosine tetraphosphatase ApaH/serine/threonine PP2A family protein phosphatase